MFDLALRELCLALIFIKTFRKPGGLKCADMRQCTSAMGSSTIQMTEEKKASRVYSNLRPTAYIYYIGGTFPSESRRCAFFEGQEVLCMYYRSSRSRLIWRDFSASAKKVHVIYFCDSRSSNGSSVLRGITEKCNKSDIGYSLNATMTTITTKPQVSHTGSNQDTHSWSSTFLEILRVS